jgi:hypothetical protein
MDLSVSRLFPSARHRRDLRHAHLDDRLGSKKCFGERFAGRGRAADQFVCPGPGALTDGGALIYRLREVT